MGKVLKERTKIGLVIAVCVLGFILLQILINVGGRFGLAAYNGVFMACQFGLCLIMVRRHNQRGVVLSLILLSINLMILIRVVCFGQQMTALPGLMNTIIYMLSLALLARQFRIREEEAVTDFLTGLLNRRGLVKLLQKKIEEKKPFHLIYVDLNNFKLVNDNYGHSAGDMVFCVVADRLCEIVADKGTITRIGEEEFLVVLNQDADVLSVSNEILERLREKVVVVANGARVKCYLSPYAGIASYPDDSKHVENLMKYADIAMFEAIKQNLKEACFFNKEMEAVLNRQVELEKLIIEGLEKDYFYLVYQPQYKLDGKVLRGFESLLRMKTPDGTLVSPGEFIPVAEKGDLILSVDDYVLRRAMREFKDIVLKVPELTISINVSAKNIGSIDFVDKVVEILKETEFPAKNLEIEITEYCLVQSMDVTIDNIDELRKLGVQVALDDFGTGYTSLAYLSKMPINLLKVDKSLVDDIEVDEKRCDFVNTVISMGHLMGCEVISEGVESEAQLNILKNQDCDFVQGYVWGKPLEYEVAKQLSLEG